MYQKFLVLSLGSLLTFAATDTLYAAVAADTLYAADYSPAAHLKNPATKNPETKNSVIRNAVIKNAVIKNAVIKNAVTKNAATKNSVIKNAVTAKELIGRWDITMDENGKTVPSWLEVKLSGNSTLTGYFVGVSGSARPIAKVTFKDSKFSFTIPPQWEKGDQDFVIEGELTGAEIHGTLVTSEGKKHNWKGVKAPYLYRTTPVIWAKPIALFNGKDLTGWKAMGENQWIVKDGVLTSPHSGANLISDQKFTDFKLHVEFKYQKGSNSGVYLRGRYEVQIEDSPKDAHPSSVLFSGVYGFLPPNQIAALGPDQWQTYDITLIGRMVTVVANGKTVISNQEIPGITGGALDSNEGEAGPIYFQGDHGPIEFRKIVITPVK